MDVGRVPVHDAAAVPRVHCHVDRAMHRAAVFDAGNPDAPEDRVERLIGDPKAIVLHRIDRLGLVEVQRQAVV